MVKQLKIRKIILSNSLEISGLSQFEGQEVEIIIAPITASLPSPIHTRNFMRFAGIAGEETALLEAIEHDISANRALDFHLPF